MKPTLGTKDALGNEIIIGNTYGYSIDHSGFTKTTIGTAIKSNESGSITLEPISSKRSLYMDEAKEITTNRKVSVKAAKLFPVKL